MVMFPLDLLLPAIPGLQFEDYSANTETIMVMLQTTQSTVPCPVCRQPSSRVHSHYDRTVADLPWAEFPVQLILTVRRFFCDNETCCRKIFVERLGLPIAAYARRTGRLKTRLQQLAFRLGGEAGARTSYEWKLSVSPATLLRLIRAAEEPAGTTPRILGVDDWAQRKGQTYGTILVDLEQRCPIDLLPERTAEALADWLKAHPGVEIITRDRATAYAQGADEGAPQAIQVADRFHLLQNVTDVLKRFLDRQPQLLRETAKRAALPVKVTGTQSEIALISENSSADDLVWPLEPEKTTPAITPEQDVTVKVTAVAEPVAPASVEVASTNQPDSLREQLFAEVKALQGQGWTQRRIARHPDISRPTVRRYFDHQTYPQPVQRDQSTSTLLPYFDYLTQRWRDGCRSRLELYHELQQKYDYRGSYSSVRRAVRRIINQTGIAPDPKKPPQQIIRSLSARQAAWLLISPAEKLKPGQETMRQILCETSADVAQAYQLAQSFAVMLRTRQVEAPDNWLEQAVAGGIREFKNFVAGLRRDYQAVKAALKLPWSNGQVEAQVHRLKLIKRQMYGRANFDLLRRRVLYPT